MSERRAKEPPSPLLSARIATATYLTVTISISAQKKGMSTSPSIAAPEPSTALLRGYAEAVLLVAASTLIGMLIAPRWGNSAVDLVFLPAVLAAAVRAGRGPAILAAVGSALAYNYFF